MEFTTESFYTAITTYPMLSATPTHSSVFLTPMDRSSLVHGVKRTEACWKHVESILRNGVHVECMFRNGSEHVENMLRNGQVHA